ncbi:MAG TPA: trypsin-like serine protease [Acidimicrobiales bacterium]|nr:trypsin-like serine protease [Acidimicrobiales bacterium]
MRLRRGTSLLAATGLAMTGLLLGGASTPATAATDPIQPGDEIATSVGGCTLNFIYDGTGNLAGKVYGGTAAHCVSSVGQDVQLGSGETFGDVALIGDEDSTVADYAFIEIRPDFVARVRAAMKGHPSYPTGVATASETSVGDTVQLSGYGLGFGLTGPTQERRVGVISYDDADEHQVVAPLIFGDSGGPLVHIESGKAYGIVSRLCIGVCEEEGPTVEGLLAKAAARGFTVTLRTV